MYKERKEFLKDKISKPITMFIGFVGVVIFIYASYMFITQLSDYMRSSSLYKSTAKEYVVSKNDKENWEKLVEVDISRLREENEDIIGWIYFENVDISYPILFSGDNSTYLRRTYTNETLSAGSIFIDGENNSDFSDTHTIIYGHNMKDLSMFGKLKYYERDDNYIKGHEYFQIITEKEKYRYKIFSYKVVADDSEVYTIYKDGGQEFLTFVKNVIQRESHLYYNEDIKTNDHLITLSTCANDDRLVMTAVRCDEEYLLNE